MIPSQNRLKSSKEIEYVFSHGFSAKSGFLFLKCLKTENPFTRFAITIGKNFSHLAVDRNRAKRITRAQIIKLLPDCRPGYDIAIFFKVFEEDRENFEKQLGTNLKIALQKAKILNT